MYDTGILCWTALVLNYSGKDCVVQGINRRIADSINKALRKDQHLMQHEPITVNVFDLNSKRYTTLCCMLRRVGWVWTCLGFG